jgi:hypothetical protein
MKHIICYSGGHSSALVACEVFHRYGNKDIILLNHDIHASVEDADIKRFKQEVAAYIGVPITFANMPSVETMDQFDVVIKAQAFKVGNGTALCTSRLKTEPFNRYLAENFPDKDCVIYYGFDENETQRINRRTQILGIQGYKTAYPLAESFSDNWPRTINSTKEIGIEPPLTYSTFKHANCVGCLKAGKQHWYVVYCTRPDIWAKAKLSEEAIGYTILRDKTLEELEPEFQAMKDAGIEANEKIAGPTFWKLVRAKLREIQADEAANKPCECTE